MIAFLAGLALFLAFLAVGGFVFDRLFPDEWWDSRRRNRP